MIFLIAVLICCAIVVGVLFSLHREGMAAMRELDYPKPTLRLIGTPPYDQDADR